MKTSSRDTAVKKTSTTISKKVLENKENVFVSESKTFTSTKEGKLSVQLKTTKTRNSKAIKSTVTNTFNVKSEQTSQQSLFVDHSTPRRTTYEVFAPSTSSRRSTYSLRSQTITNIIDVEREKRKFEAIASPGLFNDSLEKAALKLVQEDPSTPEHYLHCKTGSIRERKTSFRRLSEEFDALNFSSVSKVNSGSSDHTGNLSPKLCLLDAKLVYDRFNLDLTKTLDLNTLVSCSPISSQHSQSVKHVSEEFSSIKTISDVSQYEIHERTPEPKASPEFNSESFSHVALDLDKFDLSNIITSSRNNSGIAGSLDHQFNDFSSCHSVDSQKRNINDTFTQTVKNCSSNQKEFEVGIGSLNLNDIETKVKIELPFESSSSQCEISPDSLERNISETFVINSCSHKIVHQESTACLTNSTLNLLEAPCKDITQTEQKLNIWDISPPKIKQGRVFNKSLDHLPQIEQALFTKIPETNVRINQREIQPRNKNDSDNVYMVPKVKIERLSLSSQSETFSDSLEREISDTFVVQNYSQNIVHQVSAAEIKTSTLNLLDASSKNITQTEQKPVIWDISPPPKEQEKDVNKHLNHVPQIKRALSTRNIPGRKSSHCQVTTKNILPAKTKISAGEIHDDSDNVFMVPTVNVKRSSSTLPKSFNTSPPKVRKLSQESKVKRLATPILKRSTRTAWTGKFLK